MSFVSIILLILFLTIGSIVYLSQFLFDAITFLVIVFHHSLDVFFLEGSMTLSWLLTRLAWPSEELFYLAMVTSSRYGLSIS